MQFKPQYLIALLVYVIVILLSYHYVGIGIAGLAAVAGIVAPGIGLLLNAVDSTGKEQRTDEQPQPQHEQQPFVETLEQRKERAKSRLEDHLTLRENTRGEIEVHLDKEGIKGADREAMLYVFGQWAKAEAEPQQSPIVNKYEIRENTAHKGMAVGVFLNKMAHYIERHYPDDTQEQREMDEKDMEFELNEDYLEEITDYILGETRAPN